MILSIRTDKPEAEIGLFNGAEQVAYHTWEAHRELSLTIHAKIEELLQSQNIGWADLGGIIFFEGPGSFTGLRIGASVANALAFGLKIPIAAASDKDWINQALKGLAKNQAYILPLYGSSPHITVPKK